MLGVGAPTSFMEKWNEVTEIEEGFRNRPNKQAAEQAAEQDGECDRDEELFDEAGLPGPAKKKAKRSQAGYETEFWNYIETNYEGLFSSFADFDRAKKTLHKVTDLGFWEFLCDYCAEHCAYDSKDLNSKDVFIVISTILSVLEGANSDALLEMIKLSIPTDDGTPWRIRNTKKDLVAIARLATAMEESAVFKAAALTQQRVLTQTSPDEKTSPGPPKGKAKGKRKAAAKAKAKNLKSNLKKPSKSKDEVDESVKEKSTRYIDDLMNAIWHALREVDKELVKHDEVQAMIRLGCIFGMKEVGEEIYID